MKVQGGRLALVVGLLVAAIISSYAQSLPYHTDPSARDATSDIGEVPAIRFLTTADYPPFNYRAPGGELAGFNIDLANALCDFLNAACTIQAWPWEQAPDALADNQGDALIAGLAISPKNGARFDFSQIYLMLPGRFVTRRADLGAFDPANLEDRVISVRRNAGHDIFASRYLSGARIAKFDTEIEALEAVAKGAAFAYFGDGLRASFWLNQNPACCTFAGEAYFRADLFGEGLAIAFPAEHNLVRRAINLALAQLKRNGTLDELYLRWFPVGFY